MNRKPLLARSVAPIGIEHGAYIRIAVPPLPRAPTTISTRACVSRARQQPRRMNYGSITSHATPVIDSYVDENRVLAL